VTPALDTIKCVTANETVVAPAATRTEPGTVATLAFELPRMTVAPVDRAGPLRVNVPVTVADEPPTTELSLREMDWTDNVLIANVAVSEVELLDTPVTTAEVLAETTEVVIGNVTELALAGTVTVAGTFASLLLDER